MPVTILVQTIFALASVGFAALSGKSWYEASEVKMPVKKEIPEDLPDKGRIILGYEDYMVTFAKITEAQERLDASLEALNQSAALNRLGALYAIGAVTCSALSTVLPLALQSLGVR